MKKETTFNLFGSKFKIKFTDKTKGGEDSHWVWGNMDSVTKVIEVSTKSDDGNNLPKEEKEITLLHEIMHSIFTTGQYHSCNEDEPLVEWTARCIKSLIDQKILTLNIKVE